MKKTARFLATLCLLQSSLHAQSVASTMNYQGKVTDSTGTGIGTGTPVNRKIRFRIYDAASSGNLLWGEQQTVTVASGDFSVLLGAGDVYTLSGVSDSHGTLDTVINTNSSGSSPSNDRYMEITVDDGTGTIDATDTPISPRQQITSTAFAYRAKTAESVGASSSLQLGSATSSGLGFYNASRLFNSYSIDGPVLYGNAGGALGSYSGSTTQKATLLWNAAGQVGVGTPVLTTSNTSTTNKLVVQGDDASTPAQQLVIRGNTDTTERLTLGFDTTTNQASLQSYTAASTAGNLLLNPSGGNVGIGMSSPGYPLGFSTAMGDKIALYSYTNSGNSLGFGVQSGLLQIHTDTSVCDVAFGYGSSAAMTETMRIKGNGNVGIGTSNPANRLTVSGSINAYGVGSFVGSGNSDNTKYVQIAVAESAKDFSDSAAAGDAVIRTMGNNKLLLQSSSGGAGITIDTSNNVGIGTTSPVAKLTVNTDKWGISLGTNDPGTGAWIRNDSSNTVFSTNVGSMYFGLNGSSKSLFFFPGGSTAAMTVATSGRVGIGTTSPVAPLHVAGSANNNFDQDYYFNNEGGKDKNGFTTDYQHSIVAEFGIQATRLDIASDARIKHVLQLSNTLADLETLKSIKITDYNYKDKARGVVPQKKVIAQDVEAVFPQAVSKSTAVVPDIFQKATEDDGWVKLATDLKVGERVRLILPKGEEIYEVLEVRPDAFRTSHRVANALVFVYGREVNDFRSVDYDAIAMLNVSATQELAKQLTAKDAKIAALEAKVAAQDQRSSAQADEASSQNARLVALEKLINKAGAPETVSIKRSE